MEQNLTIAIGLTATYQGPIQREIDRMLDREVVKEFLEDELKGIEIPKDIPFGSLVGTFCKFTEDDYYEWLKDNFKSFFNHGNPDWDWIRGRIEHYSED
ncbi:MAG: hypothetical protein AB1665_06800 [Candidatus Thermoplasmatota archaeon]